MNKEEREQLNHEAKEIASVIFGVDVIHTLEDGSFFKTGPFMDRIKRDAQEMHEKMSVEFLKELEK